MWGLQVCLFCWCWPFVCVLYHLSTASRCKSDKFEALNCPESLFTLQTSDLYVSLLCAQRDYVNTDNDKKENLHRCSTQKSNTKTLEAVSEVAHKKKKKKPFQLFRCVWAFIQSHLCSSEWNFSPKPKENKRYNHYSALTVARQTIHIPGV